MDDPVQSQHDEEKRQLKAPLIVGVGASAASMDSIERFFGNVKLDRDQAVVLVLQFRDAIADARLQAMLQRVDGGHVAEITDGLKAAGGNIYVCPGDMITTVADGHFSVRPAEQGRGERATIDSFLVSLAEERAEESIGVVLAGTAGEGTLGVATLKDHGGLAIAERTADNQDETHLDHSTSAAAIADYVLPPEQIPEHIQVYARHLRRLEEKQGFDEVVAAASASLSRIADVLRKKTGNDFHGYKQNTFLRRVQRRMQVVQ